MKTMSGLNSDLIAKSRAFFQEAFNHARGVNDHSTEMASCLMQDIKHVNGILTISELSNHSGKQRDTVIGLTNWQAVKTLTDRVNHYTSPELYSPLKAFDPHMAEAYLNLKWSIGQLELAIYPPKGTYEEAPPLADGPVVR